MSGDMIVHPATAGYQGFDTPEKLTAKKTALLRQAGFRFALRYLSRKSEPPDSDLTPDEVQIILDAGLSLMAVQHVAKAGWDPSEQLGKTYGENAAAHAAAVGLPRSTSVWLDLEEVKHSSSAESVIAYCNAWFKEVEAAGYTTGVYVGANSNLSGDQLYWRLKTARYWRSGSNVPDTPVRGYCMVQHILAGDKVGGVRICRDVTSVDAFGNAPMLVSRAQAAREVQTLKTVAPIAAALPTAAVTATDTAAQEALLRSLAADHDLVDPMEALIAFRNEHGAPLNARYWAIANFNLHSAMPRLFLFDVKNETVQRYLCAHGKGSEGKKDDGFASVFSNKIGSNSTSLGVYRCAETYEGKHNYSMRLDGLEGTNSNARDRAVVMHGADYVSPQFIEDTGRIGRSDGCLALENQYVTEVINALTGGSLVIAWHTET